jgi:hypothetical protein
MTSTPTPTAGDVYEHELVPPQGGRVRRALAGVSDAIANVEGGPVEVVSVGDVVVRRRDDGSEVLREAGGGSEEAAQTVRHLEGQLATLSPEEFRERWGIGS